MAFREGEGAQSFYLRDSTEVKALVFLAKYASKEGEKILIDVSIAATCPQHFLCGHTPLHKIACTSSQCSLVNPAHLTQITIDHFCHHHA